jgi:hypothetical protein
MSLGGGGYFRGRPPPSFVRSECEHVFVARRRHRAGQYRRAMSFFELGHGSFKVARLTGIPRSTVRYWRRIGRRPGRLKPPDYSRWRPGHAAEASYCYLLGLYLGDGCLTHHGNAFRLILTLDKRYPEIIQLANRAIGELFPETHVLATRSVLWEEVPPCGVAGCDRDGAGSFVLAQSSFKNISIAHRDSVAMLEAFVGPRA